MARKTNTLTKLLRLQRGECAYCKTQIGQRSGNIDHFKAKGNGGSSAIENLVASCRPCNAAKGTQDIPLGTPVPGRERFVLIFKAKHDAKIAAKRKRRNALDSIRQNV